MNTTYYLALLYEIIIWLGAKIIENISEDLHSPITYPIGIVKATKNEEAAKDFVDLLFTDTSNTIFEKYGYTPCK